MTIQPDIDIDLVDEENDIDYYIYRLRDKQLARSSLETFVEEKDDLEKLFPDLIKELQKGNDQEQISMHATDILTELSVIKETAQNLHEYFLKLEEENDE